MTREEAIEVLNGILKLNYREWWDHKCDEAVDMAIEALSTPSGDLISRADAKQAIRDRFPNLADRLEINNVLNNVPSADAVEVVWCKDCRHQEHCHETAAHTKDHDGFREHWSEPIEWCSRGERREE